MMRKVLSRGPWTYILLFIVVALVMFSYELIKEVVFNGALTPWESHTITIFLTSLLSVFSAVAIRSWSSNLLKKEQMLYLEKEKAITQEYLQAKEDAELLANTFLNYAGALVVVLDHKGHIIQFNRASEKLSGLTFDEVKGKFPWDTFLPPEDAMNIRKNAFNVLADNPLAMSGSYTNYWITKGNGRALIEWANTVVLDDQQRMSYLIAVGTDITERKRMESGLKEGLEVYQAAINTSSMGFWVVDMQGRLNEINDAYLIQSGYSREELLNMNIPDLDAEQTPNEVEENIKMVIEKGSACFRTKHRRKDGSIWPVEIVTNFSNVQGGRFFVFLEDITKKLAAEEKLANYSHHLEAQVKERTSELEAARHDAEYANHAKSEFLSSMSHELRTPMNAILGFGQILELNSEGLNEIQRDNIKEILGAGYHLLNLINEVLDLAKIESGNMEVFMEEVCVNTVLKQCIHLITPQLKSQQLKLIDKISRGHYFVKADSTRLTQVLLNLLSNAVKYNSEHGSVSLNCKTIDNQQLRICVTDTGKGLTENEITKLFTPFERLDAKQNIEGTGIGLIITQHLMALMNGDIGIESLPGKGSTFWIELELAHES